MEYSITMVMKVFLNMHAGCIGLKLNFGQSGKYNTQTSYNILKLLLTSM